MMVHENYPYLIVRNGEKEGTLVINKHNIPIDKMGVMQLYLTCQTFLVMNGLIITEGELCCENKLLAKDAEAMIEVKTP